MLSGVGVVAACGLIVAAAACSQDGATPANAREQPGPRIGPPTPSDRDRVSPEQQSAIAALAAVASPQAPDPTAGHHGHGGGGPTATVVLDLTQQATFDREWAAAVGAVTNLDTPAEAAAAGYTRSAVQGAGVGVHWVNWTLIDAPFEPAHPAMLLFDEGDGGHDLVGFSYWVRATQPEGFTGPNDVWHQHTNLCVVNGWIDRENSASPADCAGQYLAGSDLWMLHARVVPGHPNRWGQFATLNPELCAPASGTPDIARCPEP